MNTTPTTYRDRLASHLTQVESWVLGAEQDIPELERRLAEAERNLSNSVRQGQAATANVHAVLGDGPDSVAFRSEIDRQVAAYQAACEARTVKAALQAGQQLVETLQTKLANRRTDLIQAQALRQRVELAMKAEELPSVVDELEALMED